MDIDENKSLEHRIKELENKINSLVQEQQNISNKMAISRQVGEVMVLYLRSEGPRITHFLEQLRENLDVYRENENTWTRTLHEFHNLLEDYVRHMFYLGRLLEKELYEKE